MSQATEADEVVAAALLEDAKAHEAGSYMHIAGRYDDIYGQILPLPGGSEQRIAIALNFWDGWCDASNHDWQYYDGIAVDDWPRFARHIAEHLKSGETATEPRILERFSPSARQSRRVKLWDWVRGFWRRSA